MITIKQLVKKYKKNRNSYINKNYNETQLRNDFIDPLLKCLNWDVDNENNKVPLLREVIQEEYIKIKEESNKKKPDYTLCINGSRVFFVEVKKPSVNILHSSKAAFQIRRYGWSANLYISVITNFEYLIIYDCRNKPNISDDEHISRYKIFHYEEYEQKFGEIKALISKNAVINGNINDLFLTSNREKETFDYYFLYQIEQWRENLAISVLNDNPKMKVEYINLIIQRLLNRIIFLRICEDRNIEEYESIKKINNYDELKRLFIMADKKYNSGLFNFIDNIIDLNISINSNVLLKIFEELYYPKSPYDFSVVDSTILSHIYERFLGSYLTIDNKNELIKIDNPEVLASNGIVSTPKVIVEQIVKETLEPIVKNKTFSDILNLKIIDICCGSGTFLISVYDYLIDILEKKLRETNKVDENLYYLNANGERILSLKCKKNIIEKMVYGVDINPYAVEVTKFSLLLKLLEKENEFTITNFTLQFQDEKILPNIDKKIKCGNSLVDNKIYKYDSNLLECDENKLNTINPFDWEVEYPELINSSGFDVILGNPPYVRIQNMKKYTPIEVGYYRSEISKYKVAKKGNIDKYYIFFQRAIDLLNSTGRLGFIVPNKFFINEGGCILRDYITKNSNISKIINFGDTQVFPGRLTYTSIIILQKENITEFEYKKIDKISINSFITKLDDKMNYKNTDYKSKPWLFLSSKTKSIFDKLHNQECSKLSEMGRITVGLQTSLDKVYIIEPYLEDINYFYFSKNNKNYSIEKAICKNSIYDFSFKAFEKINCNSKMIFPYQIVQGKAILLKEEIIKEKFPLAWSYLLENKKILEKRNLQGKCPKWYQYGRSQNLATFHNVNKIIWPVLSKDASYSLDTQDLYFTGGGNGPYYSFINNSDYSILYILGILNSPIIEKIVKSKASIFQGEYYSHGKQYINDLPIKKIDFKNKNDKMLYDEIITLVKKIIYTNEKIDKEFEYHRKTCLKRKLNLLSTKLANCIKVLYKLTENEFNAVMLDELL